MKQRSEIEERLTFLETCLEMDLSFNTIEKMSLIFKNTQEEERETLAKNLTELVQTIPEKELLKRFKVL